LAKKVDHLVGELEEQFRFLKEIGADFIFTPKSGPKPGSRPSSRAAREEILTLHEKVLRCKKCPLALGRTHAVPGEGNLEAELMFIGEGPGHDEDIQGRPFVGRAGQLLTKIIQAMKFEREDVFIANVVKCRPPENRTPHRDEVARCSPFLLEQIRLIQPKVIVTLGKVATDFFVPSASSMTSLRGQFYVWNGIQVMPTFHPSYLIRNEGNREIRKMVWDDMQKVMALLGKK
jgi:uracil-DNA glycosylase family 4